MKQRKEMYLGFRATTEQATKLATIAERAGVGTSDVLRLLVDEVRDVKPGWSVVWASQGQAAQT